MTKRSAPAVDPAREREIEADARGDIAAERVCEIREARLERRIAGAEHDELRAEAMELGHDLRDEIEPLLIRHARDHADQWLVRCEREADLGRERVAARGFPESFATE